MQQPYNMMQQQKGMTPAQANIQSMGQTARAVTKPQGLMGGGKDVTSVSGNPEQKNAAQLAGAVNAASNDAKNGPATSAGSYGVTTGQTSNTGLISGQMMSRRI